MMYKLFGTFSNFETKTLCRSISERGKRKLESLKTSEGLTCFNELKSRYNKGKSSGKEKFFGLIDQKRERNTKDIQC